VDVIKNWDFPAIFNAVDVLPDAAVPPMAAVMKLCLAH
jgi:hypothetical protein